jgi:hypothetical protein
MLGSSFVEALLGQDKSNSELRRLKQVLARKGIELANSTGYSEATKKASRYSYRTSSRRELSYPPPRSQTLARCR